MEIGVAEIVETEERKRPTRGRTSPPGSGNNGLGPRRPGGGGSSGRDDNDADPTAPNAAKSRFLTYFLLLVVVMTFGGVIAAYVVLATNQSLEWQPFALPMQVWVSTAIIAASSFAYIVAERAMFAERFLKAKKWLIATTALGATFISSQLILWIELASRGVYAAGNPYAGFFYILTALHAIHVIGGIIALASILLRSWHLPRSDFEIERRQTLTKVVGWYWHLMGGLWLVLIGLLAFWK
jgi:cytochrome c oxidase subunit 3